jgi:hypothetical protein
MSSWMQQADLRSTPSVMSPLKSTPAKQMPLISPLFAHSKSFSSPETSSSLSPSDLSARALSMSTRFPIRTSLSNYRQQDLSRVRKPLRRATGYSADVEGWIVFDPSRGFDLRCHQAFDHSRTTLNRNWFVPAVSTLDDGADRKYELDHGLPRLVSFEANRGTAPKVPVADSKVPVAGKSAS